MANGELLLSMFAINQHIQRARLLLQQGRVKDAEQEISYALRENPEDADALMLLAECKIDTKQWDEGLRLLQNAASYMPYYHRIYYLIAFCYYRKGDKGLAVDELKKAIELNPEASAYYGLYAYILLDMHRYTEALEKANEGLAVYAEDLTCLNARSQALIRLKNKDEAFETIREALSVDPEDDFTHTNVGWIYLEKGKHTDARQHFREALRINPNNKRAKQGYKESLKARLPPYRWLLMFSLWLSAKSKQARWATVIIIWASVRLLSGVSAIAGGGKFAYILIGLYVMFVIFSWVGASMANLVLLFTKEGKYVLSDAEKRTAGAVALLLVVSAATAVFGRYLPGGSKGDQYFAALIFLTMVLPASRFEFAHLLRRKKLVIYYSAALLLLGLVSAIGLLAGSEMMVYPMLAYFVGLVVYTWGFSFAK